MPTTFRPLGYTGRPIAPMLEGGVMPLAGGSLNLDTHRGVNWPSRGYRVVREVGDSHSKACFTWNHLHTDEGQTGLYLYDTALYPETGSDNPTALKTGLTASFKPVFVSQGEPTGHGVFLNGTNSEAQLIQEISSSLDARDFDFAAPGDYSGDTTTPANGTSLEGTYHALIVYEDDDGAILVTSAPTFQKSIVVASGDSIDFDISNLVHPTRAKKWSVYISAPATAGGTAVDSIDSYVQQLNSEALATETYSFTAYDSSGATLPHINETTWQATMPLTNVSCAAIHDGCLFIGSESSNKVYFSRRNNFNEWNTARELNTGTETGTAGGVVGMISAYGSLFIFTHDSIFRAWGPFAFEDQGDNPTWLPLWSQARHDTGRGLVGPNAATTVDGQPFFFSQQGLAIVTQNGSTLVAPVDAQGMLDDLDHTYRDRWVLSQDPNGYVCALVTRFTNSSRPQDGASIAGIADRILRYDFRNRLWACPLAMGDITHLSYRTQESAGTVGGKPKLMAGSMTGRVLELGIGASGGVLDTSGSEYDGQAATAEAATTVSYIEAGISADAYNGYTVTLYYSTDDDNYPGLAVQKTIVDTAVSGSTVTLTWVGSLTTPAGSGTWTVRVAGLLRVHDFRIDPGTKKRLKWIRAYTQPVIGVESVG